MKNVNMALCSAVFCAVGAAGSELIGSQLFRSQLRCPVRSNHVEAGRMRLCLHDPAKLPSLVCSAPSGSIPSTRSSRGTETPTRKGSKEGLLDSSANTNLRGSNNRIILPCHAR